MKSKKSLKALIVSVLSLIVCMSLFVGSTFAWFTDSAVGKNQVIQSGNLDMVVTASMDGDSYDIVENVEMFDSTALWEPGYVEYAYVNVDNNGTLSFEYSMDMNIISEVAGINQNDQSFKLSQYIRYGIISGKHTFATRYDAIAAVDATSTLLEDRYFEDEIVLLPGEDHDYTIVVYMPTSVGNEANYKTGTAVPTINFGMIFNATQYNWTNEEDDFDYNYDVNAVYPQAVTTTAELQQAIAQGYTIVNVDRSIALSEQLDVANGTLTLIGSNDNVVITAPAGGSRIVNAQNNTEDVTVNLVNLTLAAENAERGISFYNNTGKLDVNVDKCVIEGAKYGINVASNNDDATLLITNSTIDGYAAFNTYCDTDVTFKNCTIIGINNNSGDTDDFAVFKFASGSTSSSAGASLTLEGCKVYAVKAAAAEQAHIVVDYAQKDTYTFNFVDTEFYYGNAADLSDATLVDPIIVYCDYDRDGVGVDANGNIVLGWE